MSSLNLLGREVEGKEFGNYHSWDANVYPFNASIWFEGESMTGRYFGIVKFLSIDISKFKHEDPAVIAERLNQKVETFLLCLRGWLSKVEIKV